MNIQEEKMSWLSNLSGRIDDWFSSRKIRVTFPQIDLRADLENLRQFGKKVWLPVLIAVALFGIGYVVYWLTYIGPKPEISNPKYQREVPMALPTPTETAREDFWTNRRWLDQEEARQLRTQKNVVHLALLADGGALYGDFSVQFSGGKPWKQEKPFGINELNVSGTAVYLKAGGEKYFLNVYQPFVLERGMTLCVVDLQGKLWTVDVSEVVFVFINDVRLPVEISANENLSLSYRR